MNRRMTSAERRACSERMKRRWAEGEFANRHKARHWRDWTPQQDAMLRELAGRETPARVAELLSGRFLIERTEIAVRTRAKRLHVSLMMEGESARSLGAIFGVSTKRITHSWVRRGWLSGRQQAPMANSVWLFSDADIEAFIRRYPNIYDWRRMRPGRWRSLAEVVWRVDPLLTIAEAACCLGISENTLWSHCSKGWLPHLRRFEKGGATRNGRILIRRSALRLFRFRRPELVGRCGRVARRGAVA